VAAVRPAVVGAFTLGGLGLVIAAVLFFGGTRLLARTDRAVVFFEGSIGGLERGAPVRFRGVRVGSVASVTVVLNPRTLEVSLPVYLELEPGNVTFTTALSTAQQIPTIPALIEAGLRAKLVSQSLVTGQMLVELDVNPNAPARYVGGGDAGVPEIAAIPSDLQELRQQLTQAPIAETIVQARNTFAAIERVANLLDNSLGPLLADAHHALESTTRTMDIAGTSIQRVQQDASAALDEGRELARAGRQLLDARGTELSRTLLAAEQALRAANVLFVSANTLVAPRSPARNDLDAMLRDLAASASTLRDLSRALERDPSMVLRGRMSR